MAGNRCGNAGLMSEKERLSRMQRIIDKRGGLPVDLALEKATTEEERARIKKKFAHQSQTKAQAAEEARAKLDQIEARHGESTEQTEQEKLKRQRAALERIIANLEQE